MSPGLRRARPSLRWRLLLLHLLVFGGLSLASPATYFVISRSLAHDLDDHLTFLARTVAQARLAPAAPGQGLAPPACIPDFSCPAHRAHWPRHLLLVDAAGAVRCSDGELGPLAPDAVARARGSRQPAFADLKQQGETLRLIAWPYRDQDGQHLVLELGGSHAAIDQSLKTGALASLAINFAALTLLLIGSWIFSRRLLAPVDRMVQQLEEIDEARLSARVPDAGADHELGRLVVVLNRMLDRLERAFAAQARFTSDVSHEIRSPLTALRGQIEVALRKERGATEYQQVLRESLEEVLRLQRLAEDLLSLAQAYAGAFEAQRVPIALGDLLAQSVERQRAAAASKGVSVQLQVTASARVIGDPDLLGRLVENLLDNAIRHSATGGAVEVTLGQAAGRATVAVRDAGEGIPAEHLPHIFERFYRVDRARARATGGAGLGLAIAQQIALLHDGDLRVQSTVGAGCVFIVALPLAAA
ncbi:MAG: HAMP domain-containing protein [Deltaproteobacteria bacterium]|nr:HAMP domain-containing protein [Deltaproteobacteria bacterium]